MFRITFIFNCLSSCDDRAETNAHYCSLLKMRLIVLKSAHNTSQIYERDDRGNKVDTWTAANPYRNPQDSMKGPSS